MKYIVTKDENDIREIFIFPETVNHDVMAENITRMRNKTWGDWKRLTRTPISAGFVNQSGVYGKSETLGLVSCKSDNQLLESITLPPCTAN
jgi:hypothetical protein